MTNLPELGTITVRDREGKTKVYPCYGCGHCSDTIILNPERSRARISCSSCGRWICEKKEICRTHCTPIYEMSADRFENAGEWGKYLPALMAGLTTLEEAAEANLVKEF